jgi:hypothetical protein
MTPQLLQAIKLLQLSSVELNEYVETELEKNPLLERANDDPGTNEPSATPAPDASPGSDTEWESKPLTPEAGEIDPRIETQLENVFQDDLPPSGSGSNEDSDQFGLSSTSWSGTSGGSFEDIDESATGGHHHSHWPFPKLRHSLKTRKIERIKSEHAQLSALNHRLGNHDLSKREPRGKLVANVLDSGNPVFIAPREMKHIGKGMQKLRLANNLGIQNGRHRRTLFQSSVAKKRIAGRLIVASIEDG